MRKLLFLLTVFTIISCNESTTTNNDGTDAIKSSEAYQSYLEAYDDLTLLKKARPALTQARLNEELTAEEFERALEKNTKLISLKQQIVNTRWQILQTEFENLSDEYRVQ